MRAVVPISEMTRRIPEAGRIRIGQKVGPKGAPKAISEFRFTSHDSAAIGQIAALYGGTVAPWSDPKAADGQYEVKTDAAEIRVVLPPDPLGGTPIYELWGGGGCERRCDGVTAQVMQAGPEGPEPTDVPCICTAQQAMACKVTTRLSVILPEIRFAGVWRLDTKGWNAAQELPGMVDMIQSAMAQGLPYATLAIKHRVSVVAGRTKKFLVPVLGTAATIEQLASGSANVSGALNAGTAALPPGDDEITDAELIDDDVISAEDAARLTELINRGGNDTLKGWRAKFGVPPAELPLELLAEADDWLSDLAAEPTS